MLKEWRYSFNHFEL